MTKIIRYLLGHFSVGPLLFVDVLDNLFLGLSRSRTANVLKC